MSDPATRRPGAGRALGATRSENTLRAAAWYHENRDRALAARRAYYEANRGAKLEYAKQWRARYYGGKRAEVFAHYGESCACCGSTDQLTIDHVDGNGAEHRRQLFGNRAQAGQHFYAWLVKEGFPAGYQTLCAPCNGSKNRGAACNLQHDGPA